MNTKTEAELEVQIVELREALKKAQFALAADAPQHIYAQAETALSSTQDYTGKVVVDEKELELHYALKKYMKEYFIAEEGSPEEAKTLVGAGFTCEALDSLRGGKA